MGNPHYHYNLTTLRETIEKAIESGKKNSIKYFYAIKANCEDKIVSEIINKGLGIDCVSKGEIELALKLGCSKDKIVFAGSGKTDDEIEYAISESIYAIHCESVSEYNKIKTFLGKYPSSKTNIALRLNPNFKVDTHKRISTGGKKHKFGMRLKDVIKIMKNDDSIIGIHIHVGSQITDLSTFKSFSKKVSKVIKKLPYKIKYLNMGGGLGVDYENPDDIPNFMKWTSNIRKHISKKDLDIIYLEPGRSIVANCGKLCGEVLYVKGKNVILDIGMNYNMRPTLYGSNHLINIISKSKAKNKNKDKKKVYNIYGPSCESSDIFGKIKNRKIKEGDKVHILSSGAYCSSMRLDYNLKGNIESIYED